MLLEQTTPKDNRPVGTEEDSSGGSPGGVAGRGRREGIMGEYNQRAVAMVAMVAIVTVVMAMSLLSAWPYPSIPVDDPAATTTTILLLPTKSLSVCLSHCERQFTHVHSPTSTKRFGLVLLGGAQHTHGQHMVVQKGTSFQRKRAGRIGISKTVHLGATENFHKIQRSPL